MMNIEAAKIKIIQIVTDIQNEEILQQLLTFLAGLQQKDSIEPNKHDALLIARTPTPASVSLDTLKKEQGYNIDKLNQFYADLDRRIWEGEDFGQLLEII